MELDKCIKNRRTIRSYLDKKVSWELIAKIIEAAHYAPSSGNIQNWRFVVVTDEKKRKELSQAALKQTWMIEAPVHIVVCSDSRNIKKNYGKNADKYIKENCAAAIQNILLKTYDLGLGSAWIGSFNPVMVERIIHSGDADILAIITIGYPAESPISKRHKIEEITYFEKYGNTVRDFSVFPLEKQNKKFEKNISKIKNKLKKKKG